MYSKYQHSIAEINEVLSPFQQVSVEDIKEKSAGDYPPSFYKSSYGMFESGDETGEQEASNTYQSQDDEDDVDASDGKENVIYEAVFNDEEEDAASNDVFTDISEFEEATETDINNGEAVSFDQLLTDINDVSDFQILFSEFDVFGNTVYINPDLHIYGATSITGIFVPRSFIAADHFEVIIYLHGFKFDTSKNDKTCYNGICPTTTIDNYWKNPMFPLREYLYRARRNTILVAPTLGVRSGAGTLLAERGFDLFMNQVLRALCAANAIKPTHIVGNIILAGHSGGGDVMLQLVQHKDRFARLISECWCYDALYGGTYNWINWLKGNPARRFYSYYLGASPTGISKAIKSSFTKDDRVYVLKSAVNDHWDLVRAYWKERILNRITEEEIPYEGEEGDEDEATFQYDIPKTTGAVNVTTCDPDIAIPEFAVSQKTKIDAAMLSAAANKKAINWNTKFFKKTNTDATEVRKCLERYVDLSAVSQAIDKFNLSNPANKIDAGVLPVDAILTEAIHQFQQKIFFDPSNVDGQAGTSTLQSMGIISVSAPRNTNATATNELKRLKVKVTINGTECNHRNWFDFTYNPSFLGLKFKATVHYLLLKQLRIAEATLLAMPRFQGDSLVQLATKLGFSKTSEAHGGGRSGDSGMHIFGLAVDIDHHGNPWIGAGWITKPANYSSLDTVTRQRIDRKLSERSRFIQTLQKATSKTLTGNTIFAYLDAVGVSLGADTRKAHQELKERNDEFIDYLSNHPTELSFWRNSATFDNRNPLDGFLNLDVDLVHALRQVADLAWGAIDFGPAACGDIMHFDTRTLGVGRTINTKKRPQAGEDPVKTHPALRQKEKEKEKEEEWGDEEEFEEDVLDGEADVAAGSEEEVTFEEFVPNVSPADLRKRIDDYFTLANATYTIDASTTVNARPQFRYAKSTFTPEAASTKLHKAFMDKKELSLLKKQKSNIHFCVFGRPKPKTLASLTQALIDIGEFEKIKTAFSSLTTEQQVRKLQREFGIGIDCAGYVQLAFIFAYSGNDDDAASKRARLGLKKRRGDEKLNDLPSKHFKTVGIDDAEVGDLIILQPRAGDTDHAWHTVIVVEHTIAGDVHTYVVDASWGTDLYGEDAGGVGRRSLMHDTNKNTWWDVHPIDGTEANENTTGPYNGHTLQGVFRAKPKP